MNGTLKQTCGALGWLLLAAFAGGCVQVMPMVEEDTLVDWARLLEPAPVRCNADDSCQLVTGPICEGADCKADCSEDCGEDCLDCPMGAGIAIPIVGDGLPCGPLVGARVLLSGLLSPLRCIGPGLRGRLGCFGGGRSDGGGNLPPAADEYHHSRFHPLPTRPVFDPRTPPFLAMDDQMGPYGSPESGPVAPVPNQSTPTKSASPEAYPSSDSYSPPTRLDIIPTPPATDSFSGDRTVLSTPPSRPSQDPASLSWVFHPPVLRDPEPKPTVAQVRRSVRLDTKSSRVTR